MENMKTYNFALLQNGVVKQLIDVNAYNEDEAINIVRKEFSDFNYMLI